MIRFNNDYNCGCHPSILEALERTNAESYPGYGLDEWCERGAQAIKAHLGGIDADVHFMLGGTQANYTVIAAALRPYQGVASADCAHVNVHETGAVENTGHKILTCPAVNGKLTVEGLERIALDYAESGIKEHITQPKLAFISFPSEMGTIYSKRELLDLRAVCDRHNMYLYVDGARLSYGLTSPECDVTLADIARIADAFYVGGTKCGALFGEAVVLRNADLRENFRAYMKQNGGMLAKGWLLGLQFATLFEGNRYFDIARSANVEAARLREAFAARGIPLYVDSPTNQQFVVLTSAQMEALEGAYAFEYERRLDDDRHCVRFCTSWSTSPAGVDALIADIAKL